MQPSVGKRPERIRKVAVAGNDTLDTVRPFRRTCLEFLRHDEPLPEHFGCQLLAAHVLGVVRDPIRPVKEPFGRPFRVSRIHSRHVRHGVLDLLPDRLEPSEPSSDMTLLGHNKLRHLVCEYAAFGGLRSGFLTVDATFAQCDELTFELRVTPLLFRTDRRVSLAHRP